MYNIGVNQTLIFYVCVIQQKHPMCKSIAAKRMKSLRSKWMAKATVVLLLMKIKLY